VLSFAKTGQCVAIVWEHNITYKLNPDKVYDMVLYNYLELLTPFTVRVLARFDSLRHCVQAAEGFLDRNSWVFSSDILPFVVLEDVRAFLGGHMVLFLAPFFIHHSHGSGTFPTIVISVINHSLLLPPQTMYLIHAEFDLVPRLGA
jgi:hypothetical protein